MIFNSKQLEELENIHDSTGAFEEEGEDDSNFEEIGEQAMDWRRGLIEEAAENIKRAKTRPVEPHLTYPIGSMLFEREARRFARVQRSVPGYLKIIYLSGGDREFGTLDVIGYLRDQGAEKRLSELCEQLGMSDLDVSAHLERLGITPVEELETEEGAVVEAAEAEIPPPPLPKKGKAAVVVEEESDEEEAVASAEDDDLPRGDDVVVTKGKKGAPPPPPPKKGAATKLPEPAKKAATKLPEPAKPSKAAAPTKAAPAPAKADKKGATGLPAKADAKGDKKAAKAPTAPGAKINPIDDPNSFIKAHYQEQSNRELARVTGLSEHTIRRKLGEWGLKRKN